MIIQVLAAAAATLAFSVLFKAPTRHLLLCGVVGGLAWLVNLALLELNLNIILATFVASIALTACARLFSYWKRAPVTVFLIPGIFPLVPGAGIYYTASYVFAADYNAALTKGMETLLIAGAIVMGILFGIALPRKLFRLITKH